MNFDKLASKYNQRKWINNSIFKKEIKKIFKPKGKILEVGVGTGQFAKCLVDDFSDYHGCDTSTEMLNIALDILPWENLSGDRAESLMYGSNYFDAVVCRNLLKHVDNPQEAVNEMIRVSKDKVLIVESVAANWRHREMLDEIIMLTEPEQKDFLFSREIIDLLFGLKKRKIAEFICTEKSNHAYFDTLGVSRRDRQKVWVLFKEAGFTPLKDEEGYWIDMHWVAVVGSK